MLRMIARARPAAPRYARALCSSAEVETYTKLVNLTLESVQEVYDDKNDDDPKLEMEVEYAVRNPHAHKIALLH